MSNETSKHTLEPDAQYLLDTAAEHSRHEDAIKRLSNAVTALRADVAFLTQYRDALQVKLEGANQEARAAEAERAHTLKALKFAAWSLGMDEGQQVSFEGLPDSHGEGYTTEEATKFHVRAAIARAEKGA